MATWAVVGFTCVADNTSQLPFPSNDPGVFNTQENLPDKNNVRVNITYGWMWRNTGTVITDSGGEAWS